MPTTNCFGLLDLSIKARHCLALLIHQDVCVIRPDPARPDDQKQKSLVRRDEFVMSQMLSLKKYSFNNLHIVKFVSKM